MFIAMLNFKHNGTRYLKGDEVLAEKKVLDVLLDKGFIAESGLIGKDEQPMQEGEATNDLPEEVHGNELPGPDKKKKRNKRKLK